MNCPICEKPFKGKIGVGVHLKRSHTSTERGILFFCDITNLIPLLLAVVIVKGCASIYCEATGEL